MERRVIHRIGLAVTLIGAGMAGWRSVEPPITIARDRVKETREIEDNARTRSKPQTLPQRAPDSKAPNKRDFYRFEVPEEAPRFAQAMRRRGLPEAMIRALMVESWKNVFADSVPETGELLGVAMDAPLDSRELLVSTALQALAAVDSARFATAIEALPERARDILADDCVMEAATIDPMNALALTEELGGAAKGVRKQEVYRIWGRNDPLAAMKVANEIGGLTERADARSGVLLGWLSMDPAACLKYLDGLDSNERPTLYRTRGINSLMDLPSSEDTVHSLLNSGLSAERLSKAMGYFRWPEGKAIAADVYRGLAEENPGEALGTLRLTADGNPGTDRRIQSAGLEGIAETIARLGDPDAVSWLEAALVPGTRAEPGIAKIFGDVVSRLDADQALKYAEQLSSRDSTLSNEILESIIADSLLRNEPDLKELLSDLPEFLTPASLDKVVSDIIVDTGRLDPKGALEQLISIQDVKARDKTLSRIVSNWTRTEPADAFEWASQRNADFPGAATDVIESWLLYDSDGASRMVASIEDPGMRDRFIPSVSHALSLSDPDLAMAWAASAADPQVAEAAMSGVVAQAIRADIPLEMLLEAETLTPEVKRHIEELWDRSVRPKR